MKHGTTSRNIQLFRFIVAFELRPEMRDSTLHFYISMSLDSLRGIIQTHPEDWHFPISRISYCLRHLHERVNHIIPINTRVFENIASFPARVYTLYAICDQLWLYKNQLLRIHVYTSRLHRSKRQFLACVNSRFSALLSQCFGIHLCLSRLQCRVMHIDR